MNVTVTSDGHKTWIVSRACWVFQPSLGRSLMAHLLVRPVDLTMKGQTLGGTRDRVERRSPVARS